MKKEYHGSSRILGLELNQFCQLLDKFSEKLNLSTLPKSYTLIGFCMAQILLSFVAIESSMPRLSLPTLNVMYLKYYIVCAPAVSELLSCIVKTLMTKDILQIQDDNQLTIG